MTDSTLADLGDDELIAAGRELAAITHDVPYRRAQAWARYQACVIAAELERRAGHGPSALPDLVTLSDLAPVQLRRLADRVHVVAALESTDGEDGPAARWWRALHARITAAIESRERDAEPLRAWMAEHPISHDTTGLPSWRDVSS